MPDKNKLRKRISELGLFYAAAVWGSTFFMVKGVLEYVHPVVLVGYRFIIAAVFLAGICTLTGKNLFKGFGRGLVLGLFILFLYIPQTIGLGITTASNSGFITGLFVAFVPVFSYLLFRKIPTLIGLVATLISISGLWILTGGLTDVNTGDLLTLIAAMTYAIHILYVDKFLQQGKDPYVLCFQQFLTVGILSLALGVILKAPFSPTSNKAFWIIIFLAVFPTFSAFFIQVIAQKAVTPLRVSLIFAFEPVFAALFAWTLGNEKIIFHRALGGLFIFLAMIISGLPAERYTLRRLRLMFHKGRIE